jgi:hypothetical protein
VRPYLAVLSLTICCYAQTNPLPLGTVSNQQSIACSGFPKGSTCQQITISCPQLADAILTIGTLAGKNHKTIFLMNGSTWTISGMGSYAETYQHAGYTAVLAKFTNPWQAPGTGFTGNMMNAACRTSTLLAYVADGSPIAVQAASGGAGAFAYAVAWYGLASSVPVAEITSGPVYADIEQGCEVLKAPDVTIVPTEGDSWSSQTWYQNGIPPNMTVYTGHTCLPHSDTSGTVDQAWLDQSVNAPGAVNNFPTTYLSMWLCATSQTPNNSAGQGYLWIAQVLSSWSLTAMTGCSGSEDVDAALTPEGVTGFTAITADLEARW